MLHGNADAAGLSYLDAGITYYKYDYKEKITPPLKSTEKGWLPGLYIEGAYRGEDIPAFGRLLLEFSNDKTKYDGSTRDGSPVKDNTRNLFLTLEWDFGYTFENVWKSNVDLTPYSGLGYRFWDRGLQGGFPFNEEYSWNYLPLGLRADYSITRQWSIALDLSARLMFNGEIKIDKVLFESAGQFFVIRDVELDLGNKVGYKIQAPIRFEISKKTAFVINPWYERSAIGKSNVFVLEQTATSFKGVFEPSSDTNQYGIHLLFRFLLPI